MKKVSFRIKKSRLFRGIMHVLNPFILLSNVNGSIALKSAIISRHTSLSLNIWKLSTIRTEFIAIATICRQTNSNECMKKRTLRLSFWQVKMGRNALSNTFRLKMPGYLLRQMVTSTLTVYGYPVP